MAAAFAQLKNPWVDQDIRRSAGQARRCRDPWRREKQMLLEGDQAAVGRLNQLRQFRAAPVFAREIAGKVATSRR